MEQGKEKTEKKKEKKEASGKKLLVVRVRGRIRLLTEIKETMNMLRLYKTNYCVIIDNTPANLGMVQKAKDYITWGEAEDALVEELFAKRGKEYRGPLTDSKKKISYAGKYVEWKGKKYAKFFTLQPPKGGYGRRGVKTTFAQKGAIGWRGQDINTLVRKMM